MDNGIISFEVGGKSYTATFGMKSKEIFGELLVTHEGIPNAVDWFSYVLHAGLCNEAYLNREPYPTFRETAALVEGIIEQGDDLQNRIYTCYEQSKAGKEIEKLFRDQIGEKKSEPENEEPQSSNTADNGLKPESLPSESLD